jgi:hypothetical protein
MLRVPSQNPLICAVPAPPLRFPGAGRVAGGRVNPGLVTASLRVYWQGAGLFGPAGLAFFRPGSCRNLRPRAVGAPVWELLVPCRHSTATPMRRMSDGRWTASLEFSHGSASGPLSAVGVRSPTGPSLRSGVPALACKQRLWRPMGYARGDFWSPKTGSPGPFGCSVVLHWRFLRTKPTHHPLIPRSYPAHERVISASSACLQRV